MTATEGIRAIETRYDGYRFRSRIEAKWAVFFKNLGIPYEYEKEGFDLGEAGWYIPDFWMPVQKCWVEIKGRTPSPVETRKAAALASGTGARVFLFVGDIPYPYPNTAEEGASLYDPEGYEDNPYFWCVCNSCGAFGIQFDGRGDRVCRHDEDDRGHSPGARILQRAYAAARDSRHEFWERGR